MSEGAKDGFENLLRDAPASLHSQISETFRARIASGEWPAHYRLKTEPELAVELGVSRGTLRRALTTLLDEGLLRRVRGRGTYVASAIIEPAIAQRLSTLTEDFVRDGIPTESIVLDCTLTLPPKPVAALLDLPQEQSALFLARIRRTGARRADGKLRAGGSNAGDRGNRLFRQQPVRNTGRSLPAEDQLRPPDLFGGGRR